MLESVAAPFLCRETNQVCTGGSQDSGALSLSPDLVHQLTYVNTHGGNGRNISCDLHNEHVNKQFKEIIRNMGPTSPRLLVQDRQEVSLPLLTWSIHLILR